MAEQRQFRFRLPWLSAPTTPPRPTTEPTSDIQAPPQPITSISTQRPPFRPAGIAPPPPPPQAPSRTITKSPPASLPKTQQASSIPPSPSPTVTRSLLSEGTPVASSASPPPPSPLSPADVAASKTYDKTEHDEDRKMEGKPDVSASQNSLSNRVAERLSSATRAREPARMSSPFSAEHRKQEQGNNEDIHDMKKPSTSTLSTDEKIKAISSTSHTRTRKAVNSTSGEQVPFHREIKQEISKLVQMLGQGQTKQQLGDQPVNVVTLAGENRGATMHLEGEPDRKDGSLHIHRGYKTNPDDSIKSTTDGDGMQKGKRLQNAITKDEQQPTMAYINSNSLSINNSLLLNTKVNERNPGVHLFQSDSNESAAKDEQKTHRSEISVTPAEKLTYEPRVRRRCLRGLFLETSDSDPDNPDKPRRHGCRYYACGNIS